MTIPARRDEQGAFLVLWALFFVALLTMVAMVIDLGRLRDTRRRTQRAADLSALAAGQNLAGGSIINGCKAAITYVKSNSSDMGALSETCTTTFAGACDPATPVDMVRTAGPYVVTIRSPISDSEIEDPSYPINPLTGSRTVPDDGSPCERMRVTVERTNKALFAGVIGVGSLTTRATAVVRGFVGINPTQNAGLVVLERLGCGVIETAGGGSGQARVLVKGSFADDGTPRPGIIQIDSKALEPPCTSPGGNTPAKYAVFGAQTTDGKPSIEAQAIGGAPGRLDMYALTFNRNNTHTAYDVPGLGVTPAPTPGAIASRTVVDTVYNAPISGGPGRVSQLKTGSEALLASLKSAVAACPTCNVVPPPAVTTPLCSTPNYFVYPPGNPSGPDANGCPPLTTTSGVAECSNTSATLIDVSATYDNVYLNCPSGLAVKKVRFSGTKFVLAGKLDIGASGDSALFPNAREIIIQGCGPCTGGDKVGLNVGGALIVNTGPSTPLAKECDDNIDNDGDGRTDEFNPDLGTGDVGCPSVKGWDELNCSTDRLASGGVLPNRVVLATGPIVTSSSSVIELCQTFVLMADGANLPSQDISAATDPTCAGYIDPDLVAVPQPCPKNSNYKGTLTVKGDIDWTAPDQTSGPRDTSLPLQYFEDLAFWTEASDPSDIGGAGATITAGVFFFPNASTSFSGQASQFIDLNAQYIARRLVLSGKGTLSMKPNPNDVVETPAPYFKLIR